MKLIFQPNARVAWFDENQIAFVGCNLSLDDIAPCRALEIDMGGGVQQWTACIDQVRQERGEVIDEIWIQLVNQLTAKAGSFVPGSARSSVPPRS